MPTGGTGGTVAGIKVEPEHQMLILRPGNVRPSFSTSHRQIREFTGLSDSRHFQNMAEKDPD
jgi:hypothetical protein